MEGREGLRAVCPVWIEIRCLGSAESPAACPSVILSYQGINIVRVSTYMLSVSTLSIYHATCIGSFDNQESSGSLPNKQKSYRLPSLRLSNPQWQTARSSTATPRPRLRAPIVRRLWEHRLTQARVRLEAAASAIRRIPSRPRRCPLRNSGCTSWRLTPSPAAHTTC